MADDNSNGAASDENPGGSEDLKGSSGDGDAGGTQTADSFAAEREKLEARARSFQGEADRAKQRAEQAEAELKKLKDGASGGETPAALTAGEIAAQVRQEMRREAARSRELSAAAETAKSEYPDADSDILARVDEYDTAEEFLAAARASHESIGSHVDARLKAREEELRKRYAETYGELPPLPDENTGSPTGDPTLAQLNAMSITELDALEQADPGVIERVQRSADQLTK